ncbi:MAG: hypothetical protein LAT68_09575 [Cyclobacteriaceae bacterium]|nr:hypothetical protein [Cyclobacteriaceae bacterium]MCH8516564.1 hypothetical protein [Cyclobacteriaceae bacterium]
MKTPPESFLILKEELAKEKKAKKRIQEKYEEKISQLNEELSFLNEQIMSQQNMMKTTIDYANRLEKELNSLKRDINGNKTKARTSFH